MTVKPQTDNESNKFISDILWFGLSQIFTNLLGLVTMPILTKTYSSSIYGIWVQVNVTIGLLVILVTLQFLTAVVRFLAGEDDKVKRRRLFGSMLSAILIFASFILIAANLWASQISLLIFNDSVYTIFVRLAFFWACADSLLGFFISYLRARGRIKRLSVVISAFSASKMVIIVILVLSGLSLQWVIASMIFLELIFALGVLFLIIKADGFPVPNFAGLKVFLTFSIPQIPVGILAWIMSASDNYFITHFLNLSETGIYSSSNALGGLIALFYAPIAYVLFPGVSKTWEQNRKADTKVYFEYSTRLFLTLAIPAAIGLAMLSQQLLKLLTTSEYLSGIILVLLIAISQIFMGMFQINEYIIYLVKQTRWLPLIIVISAGISIGLNVILIPYLGITGAAVSKVAAYFVLAVVVTTWTKRVINYNFNFKYVSKIVVSSLIMAICLYFLKIGGIGGIIISVIVGTVVFILAMLLMKAFTQQDKRLIMQTLHGMIPRMR